MKLDEKIVSRLERLIADGESLLNNPVGGLGDIPLICGQRKQQWVTSCQSLITSIWGRESDYYRNFTSQVNESILVGCTDNALGVIIAAKDDYVNGWPINTKRLIEAEIFDDFLEQASHLLELGYYLPAAVIAGSVLEDGIRKLSVDNDVHLDDRPKLDKMNVDLAKAGIYNSLTQKKITALADLRNKAAHGKVDEFTQQDVEAMLRDIRDFMERFFA